MKHKIYNLVIVFAFGLLVLNPALVYAQGTQDPKPATSTAATGSDLPVYQGVDGSIKDYLCTPSEPADGHDLERCINRLFRFGITAGALVAVFFIVFTGYLYITGGESAKTKAKQMLYSVFTGMAILLGGYLLLYFINPSLVIFKPIQPPIFDAADLPSCEDVGFGVDCVIKEPGGGTVTSTGGYADCPDGLIAFDKKVVPVNGGGDTEKICKAMWEKLVQIHKIAPVIATATIGPGHDSKCHSDGNPKSGTCVDMVPKDGDFAKLCRAVKSVGSVVIVNESGGSESDCGKAVTFAKTTGKHLHIYLTNGGGGASSGTGGTRPNCVAVKDAPGMCGHSPGTGDRYKEGDFASADPDLKKAFDALKAKYPNIREKQVYRDPQYGAHMRSVFEVLAYEAGWTESEIRKHGQYCSSQNILYVTAEQAKNAGTKKYAAAHKNHFSSLASPTTCYSDHGKGLAVDIDGIPAGAKFLSDAKALGLCRTVPIFKTKNITMNPDTPHFALFNKLPGKSSNCVTY